MPAVAHDFSHLTGAGGEVTNLNLLRTQNIQLQNEVQRLTNELAMRAQPTLANLTDAIFLNTQVAARGNEQAKQQLQLLLNALKGASELLAEAPAVPSGRIVVPR